jgi:transposase
LAEIHVDDLSTVMGQHNEDEEHLAGQAQHSEEVHRHEPAHDGREGRAESYDGGADLAHVRAQASHHALVKISPDRQLVDRVRDIVGLYMNPPHSAVVFAFDEKSQIQVLERANPSCPWTSTSVSPNGGPPTTSGMAPSDLSAALNVATGEVLARCKRRHRAQDFVACLRQIDALVTPGLAVHVVLDNLSPHRTPAVHRWLLRHPHIHFHFTPTYASWLNLVERFFGLTEKALRRGSHTSVPQLREATLAYVDAHNENKKPFQWTKTAERFSTRCGALAFAPSRCRVHDRTFVGNHVSRGL